MKNICLTFVTLILLTGCYKRDELHVNETCTSGCAVFNIKVSTGNNSAVPVNNAYVELTWTNIKPESFFGNPSTLIAKGYTDNNGKISFSFKGKGNEFTSGEFKITAKSTSDYFAAYNSFFQVTKSDTVLNAHIHLPSKAFLKLVFKNFDPKISSDYFDATPYFNNYGSEQFALLFTSPDPVNYPNTFFLGNQKPFTSLTFTGETAGDQYTYFAIVKWKNGVQTFGKDSIFIAKGDTKTFEVDYQK